MPQEEDLPRPVRTVYIPPELTDYYELSLDKMLEITDNVEEHTDRYRLVIKAARLAREINAARSKYAISSPEKPTKVALNEIEFQRVFEPRTPHDLAQVGGNYQRQELAEESAENEDID